MNTHALALIDAVRSARELCAPDERARRIEVAAALADRLAAELAAASPRPRPSLSPRERDTLEALLTGASEKQIALALGISCHTVHQYVKRIYRAFGVRSRAELMASLLRG